jgi:hypothetical protein
MTRIVLAIVLGMWVPATVAAQDTLDGGDPRCNVSLVRGRYGILQTGFDGTGKPRNGVGVATFDGKGHWTLAITEVKTGTPDAHIANPGGTYAVRPDCSGTATLAQTPMGTVEWEFVVVDDGRELLQVATTPARGIVTWILKRQFSK